MRKLLLSSVALVPFVAAAPASALTLVSTIDGCYDCVAYDTPSLMFNNTTSGANAGTFINAQMVLTPYQAGTAIAGVAPKTVALPNMAPGTTTTYTWLDGYPGTIKGDLTSYDFDHFVRKHFSLPRIHQRELRRWRQFVFLSGKLFGDLHGDGYGWHVQRELNLFGV